MTYHKINVSPLSQNQQRNLIKGKGVRIKHSPNGKHYLHLSQEQLKRLERAHRAGRGMVLTMDPYQMENHKQVFGTGIFGKKFDAFVERKLGKEKKDKIYGTINKFVKPVAKFGINMASKMGEAYGVPAPVMGAMRGVANDYIDDPGKFQGQPRNQTLGLLRDSAFKGAMGAGVSFHKSKPKPKPKPRCRGGALFPAGGALYPAGF